MASILLKRECEPGNSTFDYLRIEYRYNTVTRTVTQTQQLTNVCNLYTRTAGDLIDAYCVNPGQPPFTRREVFSDGDGDVTFTDTDGSPVCAPGTCTLTATVAVNDETANDLGTATVTVTGNVGAYELSLDDFQDTSQTDTTFPDLPAGDYLLTVREVRASGCATRVPFTVATAYGLRYRLSFYDANGLECRADIHVRGYSGSVETLRGSGQSPVIISWPGSATDHLFSQLLKGSECELNILCTTAGQLADLYASDERRARVEVWRSTDLLWMGWCLPEQWTEPLLAPPYQATIRATDGLGALADKPFAYENGAKLRPELLSHLDTLRHCFALAGHKNTLPVYAAGALWSDQMQPDDTADYLTAVGTWTHGWRDNDNEPWAAGDVLKALLEYYGLRLYQWGGAWHLERLIDLSPTTGARRIRYTAAGAFDSLTTDYRPEATVDPFDPTALSLLHWVQARQTLALRPAVREVILTNEENAPLNLIPEGDGWPEAAFTSSGVLWQWRATATYAREADPDAPAEALLRLESTSSTHFLRRTLTVYASELPRLFPTFSIYLDVETTAELDELNPEILTVEVRVNGVLQDFDVSFKFDQRREVCIPFNVIDPDTLTVPTPPVEVDIRLMSPDADVLIRQLQLVHGRVRGAEPDERSLIRAPVELTDPEPVVKYEARTSIAHATRKDEADRAVTEASEYKSYVYDASPLVLPVDSPTVWQRGVQLLAGGAVRRWFEDSDGPQVWADWATNDGSGQGPGNAASDFVARDRALWQSAPAKVISGVIAGALPQGPGTLLYDPYASNRLFVQTDTRFDVARAEWEVTAAEMLTAIASTATGDRLLLETGDALLLETGDNLLQENG